MQAVFYPQDVFNIKGRGTVMTGILKSGMLAAGMSTVIGNKRAVVQSIEMFSKTATNITAPPEQNVGILLSEITKVELADTVKSHIQLIFTDTKSTVE